MDVKEKASVNTFVKFVPGNEIRFIGTETQQVGQIITNPSDPTKSQFLNESLPALEAGRKVVGLSVVTKHKSGERQYVPTDKIRLSVDSPNDVSDIEVTDHRNAHYEVSFVPRVPGHYQVQVNLNSEIIAGSPVEMNIAGRNLARLSTYNMPGETGSEPCGVAVSKEGEIAFSDNKNSCITIADKAGNFLRKLSRPGDKKGKLNCPRGVAFNSCGELVVADTGNHRIQVLDKRSGQLIGTFGRQGSATGEFVRPAGVCVDNRDRVIVTDCGNHRVQVFDEGGKFLFQFGNKFEKLNYPFHCVTYQDSFIVADKENHVIKAFDSKGQFLYKFGGHGNEDGQFGYPGGLVVDGRGNLFVRDRSNERVQMFTMDGRFVGKTACELRYPVFTALLDDDKLVITEMDGGRISIVKLT